MGEVSASADVWENQTAIIGNGLTAIMHIFLMLALCAITLEIMLIVMYASLPIIRQMGLFNKYIPLAIKERIDTGGFISKKKKQTNNPLERVEFIIKQLEKERVTDQHLDVMIRNYNEVKNKSEFAVVSIQLATQIEQYYIENIKNK